MRLAAAPAALALSSVLAVSLARAQNPTQDPATAPPPPDAAAMVEGACTACHGLDFIAEHRMDRDDWDFTVRRMVDRGADLDFEAIPLVVDYLARTYPKPPDTPADRPPG
jgi:cytochrome c5